MNTPTPIRQAGLLLAILVLPLCLAGCATNKVDWTARVGTYTFDQAVLEMGPPAKQAKLQDGTTVAEWLIHRGYTETYYSPYYYGYRYRAYGPVMTAPVITRSPDTYIRLTFNPEGKLTAWRKVSI